MIIYTLTEDEPYWRELVPQWMYIATISVLLLTFIIYTSYRLIHLKKTRQVLVREAGKTICNFLLAISFSGVTYRHLIHYGRIKQERKLALESLESKQYDEIQGIARVLSKCGEGCSGYDLIEIGNKQFKIWYKGAAISYGYKGVINNGNSCFKDGDEYLVRSYEGNIIEIQTIEEI